MRNTRGGGQGEEGKADKEWMRRSGMDEEKKRQRVEGEEEGEEQGKKEGRRGGGRKGGGSAGGRGGKMN